MTFFHNNHLYHIDNVDNQGFFSRKYKLTQLLFVDEKGNTAQAKVTSDAKNELIFYHINGSRYLVWERNAKINKQYMQRLGFFDFWFQSTEGHPSVQRQNWNRNNESEGPSDTLSFFQTNKKKRKKHTEACCFDTKCLPFEVRVLFFPNAVLCVTNREKHQNEGITPVFWPFRARERGILSLFQG